MTGGKYLLDTNVLIPLLAGDASVRARVEAASAIGVPLPALGELYYGACRSARAAENVARVEQLAQTGAVLDCDRDTAREYGLIKNRLRERGRPIPENDVWIAALARQHDLVLVTRDDHFAAVEGLRRERW